MQAEDAIAFLSQWRSKLQSDFPVLFVANVRGGRSAFEEDLTAFLAKDNSRKEPLIRKLLTSITDKIDHAPHLRQEHEDGTVTYADPYEHSPALKFEMELFVVACRERIIDSQFRILTEHDPLSAGRVLTEQEAMYIHKCTYILKHTFAYREHLVQIGVEELEAMRKSLARKPVGDKDYARKQLEIDTKQREIMQDPYFEFALLDGTTIHIVRRKKWGELARMLGIQDMVNIFEHPKRFRMQYGMAVVTTDNEDQVFIDTDPALVVRALTQVFLISYRTFECLVRTSGDMAHLKKRIPANFSLKSVQDRTRFRLKQKVKPSKQAKELEDIHNDLLLYKLNQHRNMREQRNSEPRWEVFNRIMDMQEFIANEVLLL